MIVLKTAQEKFLNALQAVAGIVERRHTLPILANVLMRKTGENLELTTSDLEIQVRTHAELGGDSGNFATTVGARKLIDILRSMPADQIVTLTANQNKLTLQGGKSRFTLQTLPGDDFPLVQEAADFGPAFSVPQKTLKGLINQVHFAMAVHDIRYYLNGILFVAEGKSLTLVATDGHRLARFEMPLPDGAKDIPGVIIPRKAINEMRKLIDEAGDAIEIGLSENRLRFSFDHIALTTKLIDGTFPDYDRVIPKNNDKVLEVNPAVFASAVDRVSTISSEKSRAVKLTLGGKTMTLSANSPDSGSASEEIEVRFSAQPMEIGFNSAYLMDVAKQIEGEGCRISLSDPASPTIIQDVADASSLYVLMPMRV